MLDTRIVTTLAPLILDIFAAGPTDASVGRAILKSIVSQVPCKAPCSLLKLDKFYSDRGLDGSERGGRAFKHHHYPTLPLKWVVKVPRLWWQEHVKKSDSPIERALYERRGNANWGVGSVDSTETRPGLVVRSDWSLTREGQLAQEFEIVHLTYLWMRLSPGELWVVCLRRFHDEPSFRDHDLDLLMALGQIIVAERSRLAAFNASRRQITDEESEVLEAWLRTGKSVAGIAKERKRSRHTVKTQMKSIQSKFGVKKMSAVTSLLYGRADA